MSEPLLGTTGLTRRFGALVAVDGVALSVAVGEIHALIGPNGAGKTTLINLLDGSLKPDAGTIRFDGRDVTRLPDHARARLGLARTFQVTSLFPGFDALDHVALALLAASGGGWQPWRRLRGDARLYDPARELLDRLGLGARAERPAGTLAHGEKRLLEIAMALAGAPRLLLLDEPLAGLGAEESAAMVERLAGLRGSHTILLVEYDMEAVFALADRVTVLAAGQVLASGLADAVRADRAVQAAYLGEPVEG